MEVSTVVRSIEIPATRAWAAEPIMTSNKLVATDTLIIGAIEATCGFERGLQVWQ